MSATAADETPLFLAAGSEQVSAVFTAAQGAPSPLGVLLLHAGFMTTSAHRNRMWTRLARELAGLGHPVLRQDFHGSGDSSGVLHDRHSAQSLDDVLAGAAYLVDRGAERLLLAGDCFGGHMCLLAAQQLAQVSAIGMIATPLQWIAESGAEAPTRTRASATEVLRQLLHPDARQRLRTEPAYLRFLAGRAARRLRPGGRAARVYLPPAVRAERIIPTPADRRRLVTDLHARGVAIHLLYGEDDKELAQLRAAGEASVLRTHERAFDLTVLPGRVHGFRDVSAQDSAAALLRTWVAAAR